MSNITFQLSNETRYIPTPWNKIVRGLGLGQNPISYNEDISNSIGDSFEKLKAKTLYNDSYILFASLLNDFLTLNIRSKGNLDYCINKKYLDNIFELIGNETNPYRQVMQYCITIDSASKVGINFLQESGEIFSTILISINKIKFNTSKDSDMYQYGSYEKVSAYTSLFFSLASCGMGKLAINNENNLVQDALDLLSSIPSPFFRGRGGGMLLNSIDALGLSYISLNGKVNYLQDTLSFVIKNANQKMKPSFPQDMSLSFVKAYPILTMLNSIGIVGCRETIFNIDKIISEVSDLLYKMNDIERTHMGLYYIMAIYNLGMFNDKSTFINDLIFDMISTVNHIDPSENYFLNGISISYVIETLRFFSDVDLLDESIVIKLVNCFTKMNVSIEDEINRPYPFSYAFSIISGIGMADLFFKNNDNYNGQSPMDWIIDNLILTSNSTEDRLYMLSNALISVSLMMRGGIFDSEQKDRH